MKIGFVSKSFPVNTQTSVSGIYKRMSMFIQAMKEMGELDMLFYVQPGLDINKNYIKEMNDRLSDLWDADIRLDLCHCAPKKPDGGHWQEYISPALNISAYSPYSETTQREQVYAVDRLLSKKPDILFVHRLTSMIPVLLAKERHPRMYFDLDDIEHKALMRSIKLPPLWKGKHLYYLRVPILMLWERRSVRLSQRTFVCSEKDRQYLSKIYGSKKLAVIPNAIDIPEKQKTPQTPFLLFLGQMSYHPNTVAADYLIREIWPIILSALPEAKLLIAGSNPDHLETFKAGPHGVEFLGFVNDLDKLYQEVRVVCCPILSGGGTRIKILEAAAYGKPIVSTTIGAEGIDMRDGEEILLRDDPQSFADACIKLLKDINLAEKIGQTARSAVDQGYDKNNVIKKIKRILNNLGQDDYL